MSDDTVHLAPGEMPWGTASTEPQPAVTYDGKLGEIYKIFLLNLLFSVLTLGIYQFWAVTKMRRYFWSHATFQNSRLVYTGTGGELFLGYLATIGIIAGIVFLAVIIGYAASGPLGAAHWLLITLYPMMIILALAAPFAAQRYRISRTEWNGIRGGMEGSAIGYGFIALLLGLLSAITFGLMSPYATLRLTERRLRACSLGNATVTCACRATKVFGIYLLALLIGVIAFIAVFGVFFFIYRDTLSVMIYAMQSSQNGLDNPYVLIMLQRILVGLVIALIVYGVLAALAYCAYYAALARHVAENTTLGPLQFSNTITGVQLLRLVGGNILIALVTLGFGLPIILHRDAKFLARKIQVTGALDPMAMRQSVQKAPRFGEGLMQVFVGTRVF